MANNINMLSYRNIIISESSNNDIYCEIKPYPNFAYTNISDKPETKYISFSCNNEQYINISKNIVLDINSLSDHSNIELYYSYDSLNYIRYYNILQYNDKLELQKDLLNIHSIKISFVNCSNLVIDRLEIYELENTNPIEYDTKKYKIQEFKNYIPNVGGKNFEKLFNEFMEVLID